MNSKWLLLFFLFLLSLFMSVHLSSGGSGTIVFTTLGRSRYGFDIFSVPITLSSSSIDAGDNELQLTDGVSVNYNGFFPSNASSLLSFLLPDPTSSSAPSPVDALLYVTERNGSSAIYLDLFPSLSPSSSSPSSRREALQLPTRLQFPLLPPPNEEEATRNSPVSMKDRPSLAAEYLVYVSTHEPSSSPRRSWAAVYSTHLPTGRTRRLTPCGIADFSPAVSPSSDWTAVASPGARGWSGEVEELNTSIYAFRTRNGSGRTMVIDHGGWPCWADENTLYFHRRSSDGWWSIYRATVRTVNGHVLAASVDRVTPPGFHAFTPAVSVGAPGLIAVATRRPTSEFRHIELIDLRGGGKVYVEVTRSISPYSHHYNPFISTDGSRIAYHRCRGSSNGSPPLLLESIRSPSPETYSLFRIDGSFPSFSPSGDRIAYVGFPGVYVVSPDGSSGPRQVFSGNAFPTAWDWRRRGVIYTSHGPEFATESTAVDIISIALPEDGDENSRPSIKKLTKGGENNAFPSPSPDGKYVVFRSGRTGHKNLFIMDAVEGEGAYLRRLTEGPWSDTMCNWSPDGEWIAFASDRDNPGGGSFAIYMVHPNGTGLRKVLQTGDGGRANHPWFSPDSKSLVFTSDYAAVSAEPISNPHHYQPYGDIFTMKIDGSDVWRLTHNSYEDGTPTWTSYFLEPNNVAEALQAIARCKFDDCHWLSIQAQLKLVLPGNGCRLNGSKF